MGNSSCQKTSKELFVEDVKRIMELIAGRIQVQSDQFDYSQQRHMIQSVFKDLNHAYDMSVVMLRLTVIDSLYSTNASYSYFSIQDMATKILNLGSEEEAMQYFNAIVYGNEDTAKVFSSACGIRKNLDSGPSFPSLMSKYAYYCMLQKPEQYPLGFPIYDSLVLAMYPKVTRNLGTKCDKSTIEHNIKNFITGLTSVRIDFLGQDQNLFSGFQQFDILDAYLWRMGKIDNGNLSLLMGKEDYKRFITNLKLDRIKFPNIKKDSSGNHVKKDSFENHVKQRLIEMDTEEVVHGFDDRDTRDHLKELLDHWKTYYCVNQ